MLGMLLLALFIIKSGYFQAYLNAFDSDGLLVTDAVEQSS